MIRRKWRQSRSDRLDGGAILVTLFSSSGGSQRAGNEPQPEFTDGLTSTGLISASF